MNLLVQKILYIAFSEPCLFTRPVWQSFVSISQQIDKKLGG